MTGDFLVQILFVLVNQLISPKTLNQTQLVEVCDEVRFHRFSLSCFFEKAFRRGNGLLLFLSLEMCQSPPIFSVALKVTPLVNRFGVMRDGA